MPYTSQAHDPARRTTAVAAVIAIHAALGYIIVTGLAADGFKKIQDDFGAIIIPPETKPTPPPPPPSDEAIPDVPKQADFVAPTPPIDLGPIAPIQPRQFDPLDIPRGPVVPIPQPPANLVEPPRPQPSFAPKGAAPRGDTSRWVTTQDYPSAMLRREAEGTTQFRLIIGTDGRVDACEVTRSSGHEQLDQAACRNIERRARFEPATDGNGQKIVGSYSSSVRWEIPE